MRLAIYAYLSPPEAIRLSANNFAMIVVKFAQYPQLKKCTDSDSLLSVTNSIVISGEDPAITEQIERTFGMERLAWI